MDHISYTMHSGHWSRIHPNKRSLDALPARIDSYYLIYFRRGINACIIMKEMALYYGESHKLLMRE